jgi:uncharacterized protein YjiS (DUF1127 family)
MSQTTIIGFSPRMARQPSHQSVVGSAANSIAVWLREAGRRYRSRRYLALLDETTLRDIGISRSEAEYEASKPFWRA